MIAGENLYGHLLSVIRGGRLTERLPTNAHPHCDRSGKIAVVHNGIVENFMQLQKNG